MLAPAALALVLAGPASGVVASSSFTLDAEQWTGLNGPATGGPGSPFTPVHVTEGGDPDGFIQFQDQDQGPEETIGFFVAPAAFLGNASANYGGTISFSLRTNATPEFPPAITLFAGSRTLTRGFAPPQAATWTAMSATITADGTWTTQAGAPATLQDFATVLPNLERIVVLADVQGVEGELTDLDTVSLTEGDGFPPTARTLTVRYKPKSRRFVGRLAAEGHPPCAVNELVRVFRKRAGPDGSVGMDRTSTTGQFLIRASARRGTYYAQAAGSTRGALSCIAARSPNLRLRKDGRPAASPPAATIPRSVVDAIGR